MRTKAPVVLSEAKGAGGANRMAHVQIFSILLPLAFSLMVPVPCSE